MVYQPDVDAVAPALELTIDHTATLLTCAGSLDGRTRRHVIEAVEELLDRRPPSVTVDVRRLEVGDVDGANTLVRLQRRVRDAGTSLEWLGLDTDHFHEIHRVHHVHGVVEVHDARARAAHEAHDAHAADAHAADAHAADAHATHEVVPLHRARRRAVRPLSMAVPYEERPAG